MFFWNTVYIYYYAEAANSGQNHTVKHNTAHSSQIKKGCPQDALNVLSVQLKRDVFAIAKFLFNIIAVCKFVYTKKSGH